MLPFFSNICERLVYNRCLDYTDTILSTLMQIIYYLQISLASVRNIQLIGYMAFLKLIDDISKEIEYKHFSVVVFIDLSTAFDNINRDILITKMVAYGIRGVALELLKNYLTNRLQCVSIKCTDFSLLTITCGVPQVSILGHILGFMLCINNIVSTFILAKVILFADDTNLFVIHKYLETLINIINTEY